MRAAASVIALALLAAACSHENAVPPGAQLPTAQLGPTCPLAQLPGVEATTLDTQEGVSVTFTGPQSDRDQLRRVVRSLAEADATHGDPFAACPCAAGDVGSAEAMPGAAAPRTDGADRASPPRASPTTPAPRALVASDARVEDVAAGAILVLAARDPSKLQLLRDSVRDELRSMRDHGCLTESSPD